MAQKDVQQNFKRRQRKRDHLGNIAPTWLKLVTTTPAGKFSGLFNNEDKHVIVKE